MKESLIEEKLEGEKMENTEKEKQQDVNDLPEPKDSIEKEKIEEKEEIEEKKFKQAQKKDRKTKKEREEMEEEIKPKKRGKKIAILLGIIIILALFFSTIFALVNMNNQKMMSGITIKGIDVSGLSKEEAKAKLETIYSEKMGTEIHLKYNEYESSLNPTLMEVSYDVDKAVEEAYKIGREGNIFINNYQILFTLIGKKDVDVNMTLNEEVTRQSIQDIGVNLPGIVIESSYFIEEDILTITRGKEGIAIDEESLLNKVKDNLNDINIQENDITIPVVHKIPEEINIDKIHEEVYKEVQDAYYTKDPFTIYPEVDGVDFDVEAAKALIAAEVKDEYQIQLIITKPKVTVSQIGSEAFPDRLSNFTTRYDASAKDRTTNLVIACQKLNGKVIMPGETFSYNQTLGKRTAAAGYKNAAVYENGQVVDGIGGGICQISSTLYNAVLMANLEIIERRNHQFVTSYLPAGRDATVVYGAIDFKFKNTRQYPIRLSASAKNGIATISIYGIKEENEYTFSFNTKTIASIPFGTKYVEDASLPAGTEKVQQNGVNGLKTETYITKMLNGKVISTTLLSRDTYDAMQKIVLKGTKANTTTPTVPTTTPPSDEKPEETTPEEPITPDTPSTETPETPTTPDTSTKPSESDTPTTQTEN